MQVIQKSRPDNKAARLTHALLILPRAQNAADKYFHVSFCDVAVPNRIFGPQIWPHFASHALSDVGIYTRVGAYSIET